MHTDSSQDTRGSHGRYALFRIQTLRWISKKRQRNRCANGQARYHLGIALLHLGRCDESIAALEIVVHAYPDYPHAKSGLGVAYNSAGQPSKAILIFEELLEAQPRDPGHLLNLGYACHDAGLVERAIECFDQVVSSENSSNDVRAKAQKALDALQQD